MFRTDMEDKEWDKGETGRYYGTVSSTSKKGCVSLVGAGPGDPGLITVRGLRLLEKADVVVFDYLANPQLLRHCPKAQTVYVGKQASTHAMSQEEINQLLVNLGREGNRVVRLKGGDPFVFGRGGEEWEGLAGGGGAVGGGGVSTAAV